MSSYRGLDNPRPPAYFRFFKAAFVLLLLIVIILVVEATKKVEYIWRWNRVPQYFWAVGETEIRAETDGEVVSIKKTGVDYTVTIKPQDGDEAYDLELDDPQNFQLYEGADIYQGDIIATQKYSRPGILLVGLWVTLEVSVLAIILGIVIGLVTGLCRLAQNPLLRWSAITYIEIIRGSPLLVQIFLWYFVAGYLIDGVLRSWGLPPIPPLWYGVFALAIFTGAYVAEIVRAGIQSVNRGQMEAARSLGLTHARAMRKVILPQAFRRIMPPLAGQFISLIKDSSLLGVMAVRELTKATREAVTSSLQSLELWFTCAVLYLVLTFTLSLFVQYLERRAIRK